MASTELEELRKEAKDLGVSFNANIGAAKLKEKINEHYEAKESGKIEDVIEEIETVKAVETAKTVGAVSKKESAEVRKNKAIAAARAAASVTQVITVIDNDQRVNSKVTTFTVNCSNEHFDLGSLVLPLNKVIEVKQGHIDVLAEVRIPQHIINPKNGLAAVELRPRFTISYSNIKPE